MLRILSTLILLSALTVNAQRKPIYWSFEGGGNGIVAASYIGTQLYKHKRVKIILQTGLGWAPKIAKSERVFSFPSQLTCNFGRFSHFVEAGVGSTILLKSKLGRSNQQDPVTKVYLSPIIGYRHESKRWFGRIYACPLVLLNEEHLYDDLTLDFIKIGIGIGAIL